LTNENLRRQNIEDLINQVSGLSSVCSADQMRSIMAVIARCTIEIGDSLTHAATEIRQASDQIQMTATSVIAKGTNEIRDNLIQVATEIRQASDQIRATSTEIRQFNDATTTLTNQVIRLNRILMWATIIIAVATVAGVIFAAIK